MDDPDIYDPQELGRRQQLAAARRQREGERLALLARLVDAQRRSGELKRWINAFSRLSGDDSHPELKRIIEVERLCRAKTGAREGDRLDVLATLIDAYEAKHYPMNHLSERSIRLEGGINRDTRLRCSVPVGPNEKPAGGWLNH